MFKTSGAVEGLKLENSEFRLGGWFRALEVSSFSGGVWGVGLLGLEFGILGCVLNSLFFSHASIHPPEIPEHTRAVWPPVFSFSGVGFAVPGLRGAQAVQGSGLGCGVLQGCKGL